MMQTRRTLAAFAVAIATGGIAGCAGTTTVRWHTLLPSALPASAAAGAPAADSRYVLAPFRLPAQVDAPQWLVRRADDTVTLLEQDRWASPLRDELRLALTAGLAAAGAQEAIGERGPNEAAATRITVDWRRFESLLGREARQQGSYLLQPAAGPVLRCDFLYVEPAPGGIDALAQGQRKIVARMADDLASSMKSGACRGAS